MAGHWEDCTDVEARDALLAGGKAQAELWNEFVSITWDDSTGAFWWSSSDKSGHPWHVPGRKFRRWVEDAPVLPDVPEGCERWEWHPEIDRGCYLCSPFGADQRWPDYHVPRARYYEFACPDGRVRQGAAPTAWWDTITQFLYSFAEGRDGRWLHASAAIVEVA